MQKPLPDLSRDSRVKKLVKEALLEDLGPRGHDVTSEAVVDDDARACAKLVVREDCVVSGADVAALVFKTADRTISCRKLARDGSAVKSGTAIMTVTGPARGILAGERVALNFIQRMSGIATLTKSFVDAVRGYKVSILDTRKTTPGMRVLEKYAVRCGGGMNHRMNLGEMILIKDNHRAFWGGDGQKGLGQAVRRARAAFPGMPVEIEVDTLAELKKAMEGRPDWILLDNMTPAQMKKCVVFCKGRAKLEASGGITLATVKRAAASGVDAISLGCLTHSARAVDVSLELKQGK